MFTEIVKLIPKVDGAGLSNMERVLNSRFLRVAKKFGGGLMSAIKGGGLTALATSLIAKVLNPLEQVQEAIDKSLNAGDDLATFAKQFSTTAGNLARLQAFGKASGLDPEGVRLLLGKFQAAVAQAAADPSKPSAVSAFVGKADTAEAFFEFIQAMQKLPSDIQKNLVQQEVFGEKQILKASEFLNQDFAKLQRMFVAAGVPNADQLGNSAESLAKFSDLRDFLTAVREQKDLVEKSSRIGLGTIAGISGRADFDKARENANLSNFQKLEKLQVAADKIVAQLEQGFAKAAPVLTKLVDAIPALVDAITTGSSAIAKSRTLKGLVPGAAKEK